MTPWRNPMVMVALVTVLGAGVYEVRALRAADRELDQARRAAEGTLRQLAQARRQDDEAQRSAATVQSHSLEEPVMPSGDAAFDEQGRELLRRVYQLRKKLERDGPQRIPELRYADDGAWFEAVKDLEPWNEIAVTAAMTRLRSSARFSFLHLVHNALERYVEEKEGMLPGDVRDLEPYFAGRIDEVAFARYRMAATGRARDVPPGSPILEERMPAAERENAEEINAYGTYVRVRSTAEGGSEEAGAEQKRALAIFKAIELYRQKHAGEQPTDARQLRPYIRDPAVLDGIELIENGFRLTVEK